ncbi:hypothetical protein SZ64_15960 [Erythrobacter sp. SG61-1L]|uniref:nuclear transport factor 2 family protein n=1 Tax=Erythrobacter sp. SG61-1L TaxID=1603897 RepID=UPI0006C8E728|nr:nuclear transport factor 2 family protein [Erythrobacter sp. SG61-1L]KPL69469.1 hypothetical protein SZ64_15960 [Erythrobacter sp. SG61-1L]
MRLAPFMTLAAAGIALSACNQKADDPAMKLLADRIAIEDMIVKYYEQLGTGEEAGIGEYYTEDAVLDVNGIVNKGHKAIEGLYSGMGEADPSSQGTFHMLLSNPQIEVNGDTATAEFVWTGIMNGKIDEPPHFQEQGREYDLLKRVDGKWLIQKRTIIADSGMPEMFAATYQPRRDYDVTKD